MSMMHSSINLGESVTVKWYVLTFMQRKYWCPGSQGHWPWLQPMSPYRLVVMGWNMLVGGFPPTDIARDVTSIMSS